MKNRAGSARTRPIFSTHLSVRLAHARPDAARLASLLSRLGLSGKERKRPSELSGGERQRVAIARALYSKPDIVLADEPTGNLDMKSAHEICAILKDLNGSERSAVLLVTHDPVVAAAAGRVAFLKDGAVAAVHETNHDPELISKLYLSAYA